MDRGDKVSFGNKEKGRDFSSQEFKDSMGYMNKVFPYLAEKLGIPKEYQTQILNESKVMFQLPDKDKRDLPIPYGEIIIKNARNQMNQKWKIAASDLGKGGNAFEKDKVLVDILKGLKNASSVFDVIETMSDAYKVVKAKVQDKGFMLNSLKAQFGPNAAVDALFGYYGQAMLGDYSKKKEHSLAVLIAFIMGEGKKEFSLEAAISAADKEYKADFITADVGLENLQRTKKTLEYVLKRISNLSNMYNEVDLYQKNIRPSDIPRVQKLAERRARKEALQEVRDLSHLVCGDQKGLYIAPLYRKDFDNIISLAEKIVGGQHPMQTPETYAQKTMENVRKLQKSMHRKFLDEGINEKKLLEFDKVCSYVIRDYKGLEKQLKNWVENPVSYVVFCNETRNKVEGYTGGLADIVKEQKDIDFKQKDYLLFATEKLNGLFKSQLVEHGSKRPSNKDYTLINTTGKPVPIMLRNSPLCLKSGAKKLLSDVNDDICDYTDLLKNTRDGIKSHENNILAGYLAGYIFKEKLDKDKDLLYKTNKDIINEYIKPILDSGFDLMQLNEKTLPIFKERVLAYSEKGAFSKIVGKHAYNHGIHYSCCRTCSSR
jgi:hypothetical protein